MLKLKRLNKALGDYKRLNEGGDNSARYGLLMYDYDSKVFWTDEFYDVERRSNINYGSPDIICVSKVLNECGLAVNMKNVKLFCLGLDLIKGSK